MMNLCFSSWDDAYKKEKVKEKIDSITQSRVDLKTLPSVNRELARKMAEMKATRETEREEDKDKEVDKRKAARETYYLTT